MALGGPSGALVASDGVIGLRNWEASDAEWWTTPGHAPSQSGQVSSAIHRVTSGARSRARCGTPSHTHVIVHRGNATPNRFGAEVEASYRREIRLGATPLDSAAVP